MKAVYFGSGDDLLGFALCGVETVPCGDLPAAEPAIRSLAARPDLALLIVAPGLLQERALAALSRRGPPPVIAILPESLR